MIEISDLVFAYPDHRFSLKIDQWTVPTNSQVAIIGPSGSGKTTLLHLLAGILQAQHGNIQVSGFDVSQAADHARRDFRASRVGMVFQQFELVEYLDVQSNILLPFMINRSLKRSPNFERHFDELVQTTGIEKLLRESVGNLSQGEQQRVSICRALIGQPELILADEPTGNLDPDNKHLIVDLLKKQASQLNATLLMVTHDVSLVDSFDKCIDFERWRSASTGDEPMKGVPK